jgi:hypothetical protein
MPSTSNIFIRLQSNFLLLSNIVNSKGEHLSYSASVGERMNAQALKWTGSKHLAFLVGQILLAPNY